MPRDRRHGTARRLGLALALWSTASVALAADPQTIFASGAEAPAASADRPATDAAPVAPAAATVSPSTDDAATATATPAVTDPAAPAPAATPTVEPASGAADASNAVPIASPARSGSGTPSTVVPEPATAVEPVPDSAPASTGPSAEATPVSAASADTGLTLPPDEGPVGPPEPLPEATPGTAAFIGPPQIPNFAILGEDVLPGAKARLEWSASQSFAGSEVVSPVIVLHGVRPGPVLCLTGAVHGDEINGVEIIRRVTRLVDPQALSGTIVAVPIVNLFGFSRNSRYLPDRRDLNRFFPGSKRGSIASRIAHSFFDSVIGHCDALVDFHTGSFDRANLPQVRADLRRPEVLRFARGFGDVPVLHSDGDRGMLRVAASHEGIPAVTFEVGAPAVLEPREIEAGVRALEALMHHLGLIASAPGELAPQAIFYDSVWVRANAGGMLISKVELGQRVVPGQVLGIVVDPINDIEREIKSPLYGRVIGMARNQVVLPGFAAYHLGEETSEDRAVREAATGVTDDPVGEDPERVEDGAAEMEPSED